MTSWQWKAEWKQHVESRVAVEVEAEWQWNSLGNFGRGDRLLLLSSREANPAGPRIRIGQPWLVRGLEHRHGEGHFRGGNLALQALTQSCDFLHFMRTGQHYLSMSGMNLKTPGRRRLPGKSGRALHFGDHGASSGANLAWNLPPDVGTGIIPTQ